MRERSYRHIHGQIISGKLKPGSVISELLLAKELGSSRTPIREAIGQLVAEGLLEQTATGTTLVIQLRRTDVIELYELREALEIYAIEKVAHAGLHADDQQRLQGLVDDVLGLYKELETSGKRALDEDQMHRFLASDFAFHSLLISMAQNSRIQKIINEMRLLIRIFSIRRRGHEAMLLRKIHEQHQLILNAVTERKPEVARRLLAEHIRTSLEERLEEFDHSERERSFEESLPSFVRSSMMSC
jgi:DNA-binding GntR family transcriptional regulator